MGEGSSACRTASNGEGSSACSAPSKGKGSSACSTASKARAALRAAQLLLIASCLRNIW